MSRKISVLAELAKGSVSLADIIPVVSGGDDGNYGVYSRDLLGGMPKSLATKVVAASNTPNATARADYECDGTADDVQIQAAIDSLPVSGGKIVLLEGTYNISATINLRNNINLSGTGWNSILSISANSQAIRAVTVSDVVISDLKILGDADVGDTAQSGITFIGVDNGLVFAVFVQDVGRDGIQILTGNTGCRVIGCYVDNAQDDGINVGGGGAVTRNTAIIGNYVTGVAQDGIHISQDSESTTVSGNVVQGCNIGIGLDKADWVTVSGNTIRGCTTNSIATVGALVSQDIVIANNICDGAVEGIRIDVSCLRILIESNIITNCSSSGIRVQAGSDVSIVGNQLEGVTDINIHVDSGTSDHLVVSNNKIIGGNRGINIGVVVSMLISGNYIRDAVTYGIVFSSGALITAEAIVAKNIIVDGCATTGILISNYEEVLIEGNYLAGIGGANAIDEVGGSGNNIIINNKVSGGVISPAATSTIRGNDGYVTENGGTSGAIATGATITHGCALTPTIVQVNAAEAGPTDITISVDATDITVNFGGGGNKTFFWYARYSP